MRLPVGAFITPMFFLPPLCFAPPPPPPPGPRPEDLRTRLSQAQPAGKPGEQLLRFSRDYLTQSESLEQAGKHHAADRKLAAADAFFRAADHLGHLTHAKSPERKKKQSDGHEVNRHLDRVYFRLKQCEFFYEQSGDHHLKPVCGVARSFYQSGVRAAEQDDIRTADEYAKAADDLTHAVENLAQAAVPEDKGPPRP